MYAVIRSGGKQYRVAQGEVVRLEKLPGNVGDAVTLSEVLMVGEGDAVTVGTPTVPGASVSAEIVEQDRARKILVGRKKRRKGFSKFRGHRQYYTAVRITAIQGA
ncbi:MAG TPA: 50S ribosomal protein L21 [Thermodesulfobacteriota bacterium]